jgi:anthranilate/para-aminobenzoate synthase component II
MILVVDMNSTRMGFSEFVLPLCSLVTLIDECKVTHYSEVSTATSIDDYQKIILSGTPLKDTGYLNNIQPFEWMRECNVPILGICAGMQALGLLFDSFLIPCKEIGMKDIVTVRENPLFSSSFKGYELHRYGIDPSEDFEILATSKKCIQGIKHKKKDIYGVLFHPEVRKKEVIEAFILL